MLNLVYSNAPEIIQNNTRDKLVKWRHCMIALFQAMTIDECNGSMKTTLFIEYIQMCALYMSQNMSYVCVS